MADHVRAFWVTKPGHGEIRTEELPPLGKEDLVIRALFSGISRGTESLVFHGQVPHSERTRMRAPFQVGEFPAPVKYGYASVGYVEHGPDNLQDRVVFVLYPHQTRYVVPANAVHPLPQNLTPERAVLAANLETAINGLWDSKLNVGDHVTVIGAGTVGCLTAWLVVNILGCTVELVDINTNRSKVAHTLGVQFAEPNTATPNADAVFHASGSPGGLGLALKLAGIESTVVELSWFGEQTVPLPLGEDFHAKRLTITSSQVGRISPTQRPRWNTHRRLQLALRLLADPVLDTLITAESDFEMLPQVMAKLASSPGDTLCHRIKYPSSI